MKIGPSRAGPRVRLTGSEIGRVPAAGRIVRVAVVACLALALGGTARADPAVVRAVLFYLPTCGHCEKVMTVDLPPLMKTYGDSLQVAAVDVSLEPGSTLYASAVAMYGLQDRVGVPALIVGDTALVGSVEIPERFPLLVEELLAAGGTDWPDIPGLAAALAAAASTTPGQGTPNPTLAGSPAPSAAAVVSPPPAASAPEDPQDPGPAPGPLDRLARDPAGNGLALAALVVMVVVLARAAVVARRAGAALLARPPAAALGVMAVAGLGIAAYLAFVETMSVDAVCGPVGDCNTVQQSPYALLLGIVPVGVAGVAGYALIVVLWVIGRAAAPDVARVARLALVVMAFAGTAFSIYLTILEPFVIGATCAWCLSSAILMTGILAASVLPGRGPHPATQGSAET